MVLIEYSHKLIPKYFIRTSDEFQNEDFDFHAIGRFRNLTQHRTASPGANFFLYENLTILQHVV